MTLEPHAIAVLALTVAAFAMFAAEKVTIETTSLLVLAALVLGFTLFPFGEQFVAATRELPPQWILALLMLVTAAFTQLRVEQRPPPRWARRSR